MVSIVYETFYPMLQKLGGYWKYLHWILPKGVEQSILKRALFSYFFPTEKLFQYSMVVPDEVKPKANFYFSPGSARFYYSLFFTDS